jgi:ketosteroid isomerase-like protein
MAAIERDEDSDGRAASHPNEALLERLYACLNEGDVQGFLAGCTEDATFLVPGRIAVGGSYSKTAFADLLTRTWDESDGRFLANVLAVAANDDHGILLVFFRFQREGQVRDYRTAHIVTFRDGRIATWEGHPGGEAEFEAAWGLEHSPSPARCQP